MKREMAMEMNVEMMLKLEIIELIELMARIMMLTVHRIWMTCPAAA